MLKLANIWIQIIQTLKEVSRDLQSQFRNPIRFLSVALLTCLLILTGIPTATAQFPFLPISPDTSNSRETLIFNALNRPFNCVNLQLCSHVWMTGSIDPLLTVASPPIDVEQENTNLPVDIRARQIQRQLNFIREEMLRRSQLNSSENGISLNKNPAKKLFIKKSQGTPIGQTLQLETKSIDENLHPDIPQIEVALENNIPVIYLPSQAGFVKQTLLRVREWDIIPNQDVLKPNNPKKQVKIEQWEQQILQSNPNLSYEQAQALVLAKIWENQIKRELSEAIKEQDNFNQEPVTWILSFLIILAGIFILSFIFLWVKKKVKSKRRKLSKTLENLEKSVTVEPDTTSEELAAKAAQAEEAINAAKHTDSTSTEHSYTRNRNNSRGDLTDLPFELVSSSVESIWQYITQNSLKQQSILKQQINLMLLLDNLLFWLQVVIWGMGIATLMIFYPPTRVYAGLLATSPISIAFIWIFLSIADKVVDFFIDSLLIRWAREAQQTSSTPQRYTMRVKTYSTALSQLTTVIAYGLATILSLSILGLSTEGLASAGIITIIVTYIFQPHITNVIRGCLILFTDQFAIGDVIVVGSVSGFVEKMNLYMTHLRGDEGRLISIPNGNIDVVQNLTKEWSRVDFKIEIAYDTDVKRAL
ncbi:MAG: mechanosensitive ion channel, partial [Cyanobacteriota bacterium]|nr:mechanosensitive ion channel [Cyanobacteriota bacterium]